ncbi:uncharacterized protein MJAP1_002543 [Malassezia japonica]|uniref:Uncharacterized protein n=1 Tax=Malassezia japonica TaxID=223818 RepID=A0AAF0F356_9BASI|nr:uncharacterized protein MJAP1_002543 [Malassezia japonica]WFD39564.1 hypothetical protein MJAP1_002543 [Malassezia japonica]
MADRPPGRPLQGAFQDEDVQKFLASQNTCEEDRIERLERLKSGPVPKTRFDVQREANEARRKRDEEESREAYKELLHDLETGDKKKGVLGTQQFVKKGGEAYVPARATRSEAQVPAKRAPARVPTPDPPPKAARKGALTDLLSEIQRDQAARAERPGPLYTDSTNLCVQGLSESVTEAALGRYFARWGDVGTTKVLPPRDARRGPTGFVAYMTRAEAESALAGADGLVWDAAPLRVAWSKPVTLPLEPLYPQRAEVRRAPTSPTPVRPRSARPHFEDSAEFHDEGYASLYSTDSEEAQETEASRRTRQATLGPLARRRLFSMLRSLTPRRERIARCMALALANAHAAEAVAAVLVDSLLVPSTPIPRKVARLYVVSDILHNSAASVPNAWRFRDAFLPHLYRVFSHLSAVVHAASFSRCSTAGIRGLFTPLL